MADVRQVDDDTVRNPVKACRRGRLQEQCPCPLSRKRPCPGRGAVGVVRREPESHLYTSAKPSGHPVPEERCGSRDGKSGVTAVRAPSRLCRRSRSASTSSNNCGKSSRTAPSPERYFAFFADLKAASENFFVNPPRYQRKLFTLLAENFQIVDS